MKKLFLLASLFLTGFISSGAEETETAGFQSLEEFYTQLEELGDPDCQQGFSFGCEVDDKKRRKDRNKNWATYKQTYGTEKIQVKFPTVPKIVQEKKIVYTFGVRNDVHYVMVAGMPPLGGIDYREAFPIAIATLCQHPNKLVEYHVSKGESMNILDMVAEDPITRTINRSRMIITPRNFYMLRTIHSKGETQHHDFFVNSFILTPPPKK